MADGAGTVKSLSASSRVSGTTKTLTMVLKPLIVIICVSILSDTSLAQDDTFDVKNIPDITRGKASRDCYDINGRAQRCMPEFVNAAFGLPVEATNTCGVSRPIDYCVQTGATEGYTKSCGHVCDEQDPENRHPPEFMTDFDYNNQNLTWWQSETILQGIQHPTQVNITLHLKKAFDITYVRLRFHSSRPDSFAIYKRSSEDSPWTPFQFYSASCLNTYNKTANQIITIENEGEAVCSDHYSDISPLRGGSVPFSTLEGRPSAFDFEKSPVLQEWVTATDIRIVLTRVNTFGDEVFGDPNVLKSYFYTISDLAVGARCKCNGHASECQLYTDDKGERQLQCVCQHNTMGTNCEMCDPVYNDRPWRRATESDANECLRCNCNGKASRCYFDQDLFDRTGHGGHCVDCLDNTDGPNCERCKDHHFRSPSDNMCTPCGCNPVGSQEMQCDTVGRCQCKPGVTGEKCDRCEVNHYDFGAYGCRPCGCVEAGSRNNNARCNPLDGKCECKELVEGRTCDSCKLGYFSLEASNPFGCISCFCYGHSSVCTSATGYHPRTIISDFSTGKQRWTAMDRANEQIETSYNSFLENLGVSAPGSQPVYFVAPSRYLGDQRFSYNQFLSFDLRIGEERPAPLSIDVILEGSGQSISTAIYTQSNPMPSVRSQTYKFRLNEHGTYQWTPRLQAQDFLAVLSNLTAIKIRATYSTAGVGFIDNINLETASLGSNGGDAATWIEQCTCPEGYEGQFCESCKAGYKRDPANGGPFSSCVPCQCNGHSDSCEPNTGKCRCEDNTEGQFCEKCVYGYYGDARQGTSEDCKPCPCPEGGPCIQLKDGDVICTKCPEGHAGNTCDMCMDGYYGDPAGKNGIARPCVKCSCNGNIDPNAVGNCDRVTGECRRCIYSTSGFYCDKCLPSYFGDALAEPKGNCQACNCYPPGSVSAGVLNCDPSNGQCPCLSHVLERQCDMCEEGYWNLDSGTGCEECQCNSIGSLNTTCEVRGGQCQCKPGVTGRTCDQCQPYFYGFSDAGCKACNCDPEGSTSLQCDENGQCPCEKNIEGMHCDRCMENKYNLTAGCIDCPACYTLVQERVNEHRRKLNDLKNLIVNIGNNPSAFNDTEFVEYMNSVNDSVIMLLDQARGAVTDDGTVGQHLADLKMAVKDIMMKAGSITSNIYSAEQSSISSLGDVMLAEQAINRAELALTAAENYIDTEGQEALRRAQTALNRFGQQSTQMTEIANRAQNESMKQMEEAEYIEQLANEALNKSREARRLAEETLNMPDKTSNDIERLRRNFEDADRLYNQTKVYAENAKRKSQQAYDEALKLYTEAKSIQLPNVDVPTLLGNTTRIKAEAEQLKMEAERIMKENQQLLDDVDNQKREATGLLNDGIEKQQKVDELLAEVDNARSNARKAVDKAKTTLEEANNTLQTLLGFDQQVQKSKSEADEALKKITDIENMIEAAENKTKDAQDALSGAESDADMSLSLAKLAQDTAQNASKEASRIRQEADETKNRATQLKDEADDLAMKVKDTEMEVSKYEEQEMNDTRLIEEALQIAAESKTNAKDVSDKVSRALETVQNISRLTVQLVAIDDAQLDVLERELEEAENQLRDADLEAQFQKLMTANDEIGRLVDKHDKEKTQLEEDVRNIMEIQAALPDDCFKNLDIESPPGQ